MDHLRIEITPEKTKFDFGGNLIRIAEAIARLAKFQPEFAVALNVFMLDLEDDLKSEIIGDELIDMIKKDE